MIPLFMMIALLSAGLFAGGALYITWVEHPARRECGADIAVTLFAPSYRRASRAQAGFAALGFAAAFQAWWLDAGLLWLVGGLLLASVIPYTLLFVMRTNLGLMNPSLDKASPEAARLLARWGILHSIRTLLGIAAFAVMVFAALF